MKNVRLAYDRLGLEISLPDSAELIEQRFVPGLPDETIAIQAALRNPIASPALRDLVKVGSRVVIAHSDITRATPNNRLLPIILAELESCGVARHDITLLNALGTHRPQTEAELRTLLGDFVFDNYRCLQHNAFDDAGLVSLGVTTRGHPVRLNRHLVDADLKILTGFIEPHFFAGFSGGPKAVLPALAGAESVLSNHGSDMIAHLNATWGITVGNPIWEEMREVALKVTPAFLVNVTLNAARQITGVFAGDLMSAHTAGCAFVRENSMTPVAELFDIVITTNSGYPLDQNLYQCVKGMSAAARTVRAGGAIIMAAGCSDGLPEHGGYAALLKRGKSPQGILDMIAQPGFSEPDQWQVQIQAQIQKQADVYIYSDGLSDNQILQALFQPSRDIGRTVHELCQTYGPNARIAVIPEGPQTIAYLQSTSL
jgi:lactate racemase